MEKNGNSMVLRKYDGNNNNFYMKSSKEKGSYLFARESNKKFYGRSTTSGTAKALRSNFTRRCKEKSNGTLCSLNEAANIRAASTEKVSNFAKSEYFNAFFVVRGGFS